MKKCSECGKIYNFCNVCDINRVSVPFTKGEGVPLAGSIKEISDYLNSCKFYSGIFLLFVL